MKTGLANLTFCLIFHNFSCVILACLCLVTADFGFFVCLFFAVFQLGICVEIEVDIITIPPPPPFLPAPMFLPLPTILSLIQVTVIRNQCAPKAGFGTA